MTNGSPSTAAMGTDADPWGHTSPLSVRTRAAHPLACVAGRLDGVGCGRHRLADRGGAGVWWKSTDVCSRCSPSARPVCWPGALSSADRVFWTSGARAAAAAVGSGFARLAVPGFQSAVVAWPRDPQSQGQHGCRSSSRRTAATTSPVELRDLCPGPGRPRRRALPARQAALGHTL